MLNGAEMKLLLCAALFLLLAAGHVQAQPTPLAEDGLPAFDESLRAWMAEQRLALPNLETDLRNEEAQGREFHANLARMRSDAAAQKATLALSNLRPYDFVRAQANWTAWQAIARARLEQTQAKLESSQERRAEQEERFALLDVPPGGVLPAAAAPIYQQAQDLEKRMLAILDRRRVLAEAGQHEAQNALDLCNEVFTLIDRAETRLRSRFFFERTTLATLGTARDDLQKDLAAISQPFEEAGGIDWRGRLVDGLRRNVQVLVSGLLLLAFFIWWARRWIRRLGSAAKDSAYFLSLPRRLAVDLLLALTRGVGLAVLTVAAASVATGLEGAAPAWLGGLITILWATFVWRVAIAFIGVAFDTRRPEHLLFNLDEQQARNLRKSLRRLTHWLFMSLLLVALFRYVGLPSAPLMLAFLVFQIAALYRVASGMTDAKLAEMGVNGTWVTLSRPWRNLLRGAVVVLIGVGGLGFVNLAWFAALCLLELHAVLVVGSLLWRVGMDLLEEWGSALDGDTRRSLGHVWTAVLIVVLALTLPQLTGVRSVFAAWLSAFLALGGDIGGKTITVGSVSAALLCVATAWGIGRVVNAILTRRIFPHSMIDVGVREAVTATVGYIVIALGVLAGIRVLGFDLTSFAIVAGALSVGAGFGMQTLVSNFVSGLIILYERPFRLGDILEYEGTTGSVKAIRTRSTIVQTVDESELVLPNSELLSKPITNWTLSNHRTRAVIPIGVAYGSDVELVRDTLVEVAAAHPRVDDEPKVFFIAFGESSLDFKLMVWVDVREKMQVVSDLHFAIDKAFRAKNIQIPYPQTDVRLVAPGGPG